MGQDYGQSYEQGKEKDYFSLGTCVNAGCGGSEKQGIQVSISRSSCFRAGKEAVLVARWGCCDDAEFEKLCHRLTSPLTISPTSVMGT